MNRVESLIFRLCPNGVPYFPVREVCIRQSGLPLTAAQMKILDTPGGDVRIFAGGQTSADVDSADINGQFIQGPGLIVKSRGIIDFEFWHGRYSHKNELWSYKPRADQLDLKFLYYFLKTKVLDVQAIAKANSVKMPQIKVGDIDGMLVPVPPLEIQKEVVRILDTFTKLEAELEAELEARRTQFAFMLDQVFDNEEIRKSGLTRLSEHGEFDRGNGLQKTDFSENGVGCIHYGQIYTKFGSHANDVYTYVPEALATKLKKVKQGNLIITTTSENIQDVCKAVAWLGESEIVIGGHSCVYRHNLDPLFATYLFRSRLFQDQKNSYVQGTKVKDIKPVQIGKIEVYVPPMKRQIEIGLMMRNFDALLQDVTIGLPAEIAARRQQYEYYRNKLLTFKKLEVA